MRLSITILGSDTHISNDFLQIEVFPDMTLDDVKGFVEAEINIPPSAQKYIINGQIVTQTSRKLTDLGINDGDILSMAVQTKASGATTQGGGPDVESLRLQVLGNPASQAELRANDSEMADALHSSERFAQVWRQRARQRLEATKEKEEMLARLNADPMDLESQMKIEELIRQERVMENMHKAYEENPESFGHVTMLYIDVHVNNVPIKAFVDSGAQTTIMSPSAAERCGIMRLIDKRFAGIARGVGTAQILGRVHSAEIQIGQYSLASSFTVMEGKDVDLLLGLDMLKRHQMCIDLRGNCLTISNERIPFLPEGEIPKNFEEKLANEPKVAGPGGTTIGAETGTVGIDPAAAAGPSTSTTAAKRPANSTQPAGSRIKIHPTGSAGNVNTRPPSVPATTTAGVPSSSTAARPGQAAMPAPTAAASGSARPTPNAFGAPAPVTEQSISQVMEMGFSREEAVTALTQAEGNVELAIGLLI